MEGSAEGDWHGFVRENASAINLASHLVNGKSRLRRAIVNLPYCRLRSTVLRQDLVMNVDHSEARNLKEVLRDHAIAERDANIRAKLGKRSLCLLVTERTDLQYRNTSCCTNASYVAQ